MTTGYVVVRQELHYEAFSGAMATVDRYP